MPAALDRRGEISPTIVEVIRSGTHCGESRSGTPALQNRIELGADLLFGEVTHGFVWKLNMMEAISEKSLGYGVRSWQRRPLSSLPYFGAGLVRFFHDLSPPELPPVGALALFRVLIRRQVARK
jgi:hypothetical protein